MSGLIIRDLLPDNVDLIDVFEGANIADCPRTDDEVVRCRLDELGPNDAAVLFITIEPQEDADEEIENVAELLLNRTLIDVDSVTTDVNDSNGGRRDRERDRDRRDRIRSQLEQLEDAVEDLVRLLLSPPIARESCHGARARVRGHDGHRCCRLRR